jgi:hypothetical protein
MLLEQIAIVPFISDDTGLCGGLVSGGLVRISEKGHAILDSDPMVCH